MLPSLKSISCRFVNTSTPSCPENIVVGVIGYWKLLHGGRGALLGGNADDHGTEEEMNVVWSIQGFKRSSCDEAVFKPKRIHRIPSYTLQLRHFWKSMAKTMSMAKKNRCATMDSYDVIANQPVVIDNGSGVIKAGFAGEQQPKCRFANLVGRPKHTRVMAGALEGDVFIGPKADEHRGLLSLKYPMEHGIVTDWNDMEKVWSYVYGSDQLNITPEEHPVLLTEAPLNPAKNREKAAEIFFETFGAPALHIQMQAVLSLYSTGRTTGVVLDSGDGVSHVVPIYEGFAIRPGIQRIDVAGRDVTRYLRLLLRKEGHTFHRTSEFEIVREMKEQLCYLALNYMKDEGSDSEKATYKLPDGSVIDVGAARYRAPEVLFRPELIGEEWTGIPQCIHNSILKCDFDLRKTLYSNIVLSGGSTLYPGFGDRLLAEVKRLAPRDTKIRISAPQERVYSTWIGGSILASLDTFRKIWVSKKEWDDEGKKVIHRKTF